MKSSLNGFIRMVKPGGGVRITLKAQAGGCSGGKAVGCRTPSDLALFGAKAMFFWVKTGQKRAVAVTDE
jgi:hypothetical protein